MGMAASQVRFLSLQNRKNTIGLNLMTLSNRKTALSRDMNRVAAEYNAAMNEKVLKWSSDSGVTYRDLNYNLLMKPNDVNSTLPYIITDAQGRVVIDDSKIELENGDSKVTYRDLAMMISAYSGTDQNGNTTYNNTDNLTTGGKLESDAIKNAAVTGNDRATSGSSSEFEYEIISTANQMPNSSLRYDLMEKLGLISTAERNEIKNLNDEINGVGKTDTDKADVNSLRGQYYLAMASYEAYRNLINDGEFNFALTNNNATYTKTTDSYEGNTINYTNKTGATNDISFNAASSYANQIDFGTTNQQDVVAGNLSYSIVNGNLTYSYATTDLLSMVSQSNIGIDSLNANGYNNSAYGTDKHYEIFSGGNVKDTTWKNLYNNDSNVILYNKDDYDCDDGLFEDLAKSNLTAYVKTFAADFNTGLTAGGIIVDTTALANATTSTISLFWGDLLGWWTNSKQPDDEEIGARPAPSRKDDDYNRLGSMNDAVNSAAKDHNLMAWATSDSGDDHTKCLLNVKNMVNSFASFYDFYAQTGRDVIDSWDDIAGMVTEGTVVNTTADAKLVKTDKVAIDSRNYIVETYQCIDSNGNPINEYYKQYYLQTASGGKGALAQEDYYSTDTGEAYFQRVTYNADGITPNKHYQAPDGSDPATISSIVNDSHNRIGAVSGITEFIPSGGSSGGTVTGNPHGGRDSDNSFKLSYEGSMIKEGETTLDSKLLNIFQSRANSQYSVYISAGINDTLGEDLSKVAQDTKQAWDEALEKRDKLFADKEAKIMDYFDALFKMISQNGWVYDEHVNTPGQEQESKNYLNAKLENNMYFITEVDTLDGTDFNYATKLATNVSKVFQVFDRDAQNVALSEYEAEKAEITAKEKQVDVRMNKLEMEQDAIKTELDSLKKIINDNIDNTFKIFT